MSVPAIVQPPFTTQLRAREGVIRLGAPDAAVVRIRVQMSEVWDVVNVEVPSSEPVLSVKLAALEVLDPRVRDHEEWVLKLHGFEVLDERVPVETTGARDGSIFLLTSRRRRPVR